MSHIDYMSWIKRWDAVDKPLVEIYENERANKGKWRSLFSNLIHDGRHSQDKLNLALSKDYSKTVRHRIWIDFSWFVAFAEYILDKEK